MQDALQMQQGEWSPVQHGSRNHQATPGLKRGGKKNVEITGFDWTWSSIGIYPLVNLHNYGKSPFSMGKSTINGPFSKAMLVYQRVTMKIR